MKQKLLYVDDEHINLELFRINFEGHYEIIISYGEDRCGLLHENMFDLDLCNDCGSVLLDLSHNHTL